MRPFYVKITSASHSLVFLHHTIIITGMENKECQRERKSNCSTISIYLSIYLSIILSYWKLLYHNHSPIFLLPPLSSTKMLLLKLSCCLRCCIEVQLREEKAVFSRIQLKHIAIHYSEQIDQFLYFIYILKNMDHFATIVFYLHFKSRAFLRLMSVRDVTFCFV